SVAGAIIMPIAFAFGVAFGPSGLVLSWQVAAPLLLIATLGLTLPAIGARPMDLARALAPAAFGCAAMAFAVSWLAHELAGLPAPARLLVLSGAGAATYFAALWVICPELLREGRNMLRG